MPRDLHELSRIEDSLTYLYIEKAIIERDENSIVFIQEHERTPVPISTLTVLMLGPGTNITHAAMNIISNSGCLVVWCGENGMRYYGGGFGETRSSSNLLRQAEFCMDEEKHMLVVRRMYAKRFGEVDMDGKTLQQLRGMEGVRMREAYKLFSRKYKVKWKERSYNNDSWDDSDNLNKALSIANACLYGVCCAAITSLGYSTGLGFIHTGKMLSFVYDIADLYKVRTTIPVAFQTVSSLPSAESKVNERDIRTLLRMVFREEHIMKQIADDISSLFDDDAIASLSNSSDEAENKNRIDAGELWNGADQTIIGGMNHSEEV